MSRVQRFIEEANAVFKTADHLAYITYPMLHEPKLIYSIAEKLFQANAKLMDAVLYSEHEKKQLSVVPVEFETRYNLFAEKLAKKYGLNQEMIEMITDLREIVQTQRTSNICFPKKESYICFNEHRTKTISIEAAKKYISLTRQFILIAKEIK